jgi:hypothetical protein
MLQKENNLEGIDQDYETVCRKRQSSRSRTVRSGSRFC